MYLDWQCFPIIPLSLSVTSLILIQVTLRVASPQKECFSDVFVRAKKRQCLWVLLIVIHKSSKHLTVPLKSHPTHLGTDWVRAQSSCVIYEKHWQLAQIQASAILWVPHLPFTARSDHFIWRAMTRIRHNDCSGRALWDPKDMRVVRFINRLLQHCKIPIQMLSSLATCLVIC